MREYLHQTYQINVPIFFSSLDDDNRIKTMLQIRVCYMNLAFAPLRVIIIMLRLTCFTNVLVDSFPNCSYLLTLGTYWKHILDRSSNSFIHLIVNNIHDSKLYNFAKTCIYSKTLNIPSVDVRWRWYRPTRQIKYMNRITSVLTQNHQSKQ